MSHAHLEGRLEGYDHVHKTFQLPPTVERDVYCAEVMVQTGKSTALVCVHRGTCYVNGEEMREGEKPRRMKNGTIYVERVNTIMTVLQGSMMHAVMRVCI